MNADNKKLVELIEAIRQHPDHKILFFVDTYELSDDHQYSSVEIYEVVVDKVNDEIEDGTLYLYNEDEEELRDHWFGVECDEADDYDDDEKFDKWRAQWSWVDAIVVFIGV